MRGGTLGREVVRVRVSRCLRGDTGVLRRRALSPTGAPQCVREAALCSNSVLWRLMAPCLALPLFLLLGLVSPLGSFSGI